MRLRPLATAPLVVSLGCAASSPPVSSVTVPPAEASSDAAPPPAPTTREGSSTRPPNEPGCPEKFSLDSRDCRIGEAVCNYPEGTCVCEGPPQCGGAARRPLVPGERGRLECMPKEPRTLRRDGCTFGAPAAGSACSPAGRVCVYGACSWSAATYTCKKGAWSVHQYHGPPPP
jgi:hypothetical protein